MLWPLSCLGESDHQVLLLLKAHCHGFDCLLLAKCFRMTLSVNAEAQLIEKRLNTCINMFRVKM